ncbi:hypothetical protein LCGC14_2427000 [marine sediment metagenome]|uniref:Uncharacterized protein n=2 Tax=root TaxID=1 RepID=A0A831VQG9_9FLAO|nr:hypothetical protein [Pricia antarctica]
MSKTIKTHIIPIFFLAAFALLRIINVHTIVHVFEDNQEVVDCKWCHMVLNSNQETPLLTSPDNLSLDYTVFEEVQLIAITTFYNAPSLKVLKSDYFFNKPPPALS